MAMIHPAERVLRVHELGLLSTQQPPLREQKQLRVSEVQGWLGEKPPSRLLSILHTIEGDVLAAITGTESPKRLRNQVMHSF